MISPGRQSTHPPCCTFVGQAWGWEQRQLTQNLCWPFDTFCRLWKIDLLSVKSFLCFWKPWQTDLLSVKPLLTFWFFRKPWKTHLLSVKHLLTFWYFLETLKLTCSVWNLCDSFENLEIELLSVKTFWYFWKSWKLTCSVWNLCDTWAYIVCLTCKGE